MAKEKIAYLYLAGIVYNEQSIGTADYGIITKRQVTDFIRSNADATKFVVNIHSPGGDVTEGFAIHDALRNSGKKIKTVGEGLVASIATVFFMAGDERELTENTDFFIHNPWGDPWGMTSFTADGYQKRANEIRQAENKILNFYVKKTGADKQILADYMKEETTISVEEAEELTFATNVIEMNDRKAALPKQNIRLVAFLGATRPSNKPDKNSIQMSKDLKKIQADLKALRTDVKALKDEDTQDGTVEITLDDDRIMVVEAAGETPAEGDTVTIDGETPEDGDYTEKDTETVYTITDGAIESITPKADAEDSDEEETAAAAKAKKPAPPKPDLKASKDPAKLHAEIKRLEAVETKLKAELATAKLSAKKAKDEKKEIEDSIPGLVQAVSDLAADMKTLKKGTTSDYVPGQRAATQAHHEKGEGGGKGDLATQAANAVAAERALKNKKPAKSIWNE